MKDGIRRIWRRGNVAFFSLVLGGLLVLLGWWIGWSAGNSAVVSSTHPAVATSPPSTLPSSLDWTRDLLSIVLSWPVVVLLILGSLMVSGAAAHRMSRVLSGFRSVKLPGGIELRRCRWRGRGGNRPTPPAGQLILLGSATPGESAASRDMPQPVHRPWTRWCLCRHPNLSHKRLPL